MMVFCAKIVNGYNYYSHKPVTIFVRKLHMHIFLISGISLSKEKMIWIIKATIWVKVFKNGPICGRQLLRNLKGYGLLEADQGPSDF